MNYFTHGRRFLHDPYFVAGTAIPDWLSVIDRKMRVRSRAARPYLRDRDPLVKSVARGVVQHHFDDDWFHQTPAFAQLSLAFTVLIREALPPDESFRPSFLGHILVELLLDDLLAQDSPPLLDAYYRTLESLSPAIVQQIVNRMATRTSERVVDLIAGFCRLRFLYDYADDEKLLQRINAVLQRVKLAPLPSAFLRILPEARSQVAQHKDELLQGEATQTHLFDENGDARVEGDQGDAKR